MEKLVRDIHLIHEQHALGVEGSHLFEADIDDVIALLAVLIAEREKLAIDRLAETRRLRLFLAILYHK